MTQILGSKKKNRCFGTGKEFYEDYHDQEWGVPSYCDQHLFEMLCLEGAQAGLNWETILKKREGYRRAFHKFDVQKVAQMCSSDLENLLDNPEIIRNRLKIFSVKKNANVFIEIQKEFGSFHKYLWGYVNDQPIVNSWSSFEDVPCFSDLSDAISKDLKKRGMSFVGTKIIYSFLQAVGVINDHHKGCWKFQGNN